MRLTLHTDFALRVLIQVGLNDGKLTTIKDIAQTFDISKAHLMKVVNDLSQKGYLDTVRGRSGGIRLMREPRRQSNLIAASLAGMPPGGLVHLYCHRPSSARRRAAVRLAVAHRS